MTLILAGSPTCLRSTFRSSPVLGSRISVDLACQDQVAVLAADADGDAAAFVDVGHDRLVDRAGQDHLDDLHGRGIGDAQAVHEGALDADPLQHLVDLRAAAMDHDRVHADLLHQHDVARDQVAELGIGHGVAAVLHDEGGVVVPAHVGQRLGDGLRHADEPPLFLVGLNRLGHVSRPDHEKPSPRRERAKVRKPIYQARAG